MISNQLVLKLLFSAGECSCSVLAVVVCLWIMDRPASGDDYSEMS